MRTTTPTTQPPTTGAGNMAGQRPGTTPTPAAGGQQQQMPSGANVPMPSLGVTQATVDMLKGRLKADFAGSFNTDMDFTATKAYALCSQGMRLRMERSKGVITTSFILISKRGGLLRPGLLLGSNRIGAKELEIKNLLTGKAFLMIRENPKTKQWDVYNEDAQKSVVGGIKITQANETRSVSFLQGTTEFAKIDFRCPIQKTGMCSSHKPSALLNINVGGRFKNITFEENPNGEPCKDDMEVNAYYPNGADPLEFIALVSMFEVMAHELH